MHWRDLLGEVDAGIRSTVQSELLAESGELTATLTASHRTAKLRLRKRKEEKKKWRASGPARH